jgi:hypothetical protein
MRKRAALAVLMAFGLGVSAAWAEPKIDGKTYCTNGKQLMWQPKGYLVPVSATLIERELVVGRKI